MTIIFTGRPRASTATIEDIIERTGTVASKLAIVGWLLALIYYGLFASSLPSGSHSIGMVYGAVSFIGGILVASLLVAMPIQLVLMAGVTKLLTGSIYGSPAAYGLGTWLCAPAGFLAARYCIDAIVRLDPLGIL